MQTTKTLSGVIEISSRYLTIGEHGPGRAIPAIGSLLVYHFLRLQNSRLSHIAGLGANTTAWTAGSSLLALGLSVPQAIGVIVGSSLICGLLAIGAGWMGSHQHLGFTVLSRG